MPYAQYSDHLENCKKRYNADREYHLAKSARWAAENPHRKKWLDQRHTAKQRAVKFNLTFEEWLEFWGDDIDKRGRGRHQLCMCRYDDRGAYEVGNIYKDTNAGNKMGPKSKPDEEDHQDIPF